MLYGTPALQPSCARVHTSVQFVRYKSVFRMFYIALYNYLFRKTFECYKYKYYFLNIFYSSIQSIFVHCLIIITYRLLHFMLFLWPQQPIYLNAIKHPPILLLQLKFYLKLSYIFAASVIRKNFN